jgi:hypothetical protein
MHLIQAAGVIERICRHSIDDLVALKIPQTSYLPLLHGGRVAGCQSLIVAAHGPRVPARKRLIVAS